VRPPVTHYPVTVIGCIETKDEENVGRAHLGPTLPDESPAVMAGTAMAQGA
jgi:hypothetical protein